MGGDCESSTAKHDGETAMGRSMTQAKRTRQRASMGWGAIILAALGCGWSACSSSTDKEDLPFERAEQSTNVKAIWDEEFPGPITELAIAKKSGDLVAATIPDIDGGGKHLLTLIARN